MLDDDRLIQTDLPVNTDEKICTFIREIDEDNNLVMVSLQTVINWDYLQNSLQQITF